MNGLKDMENKKKTFQSTTSSKEILYIPRATYIRQTIANKSKLPQPIQSTLQSFLEKFHASEESYLSHEYKSLCKSVDCAPGKAATLSRQTEITRRKNRYTDVLPYEDTRVKLYPMTNGVIMQPLVSTPTTHNDYINASYIHPHYIACCAPVPNAVEDFWLMVWQNNVSIILMLTNFIERRRIKAELYWNEKVNTCTTFSTGLNVQLVLTKAASIQDGCIRRTFKLWTTNSSGKIIESRVVQHMQFTDWPDHGTLLNLQEISPMLEQAHYFRVEKNEDIGQRMVVHCSAGIGRSGTIIAIDILLDKLYQALQCVNAAAQAPEDAVKLKEANELLKDALDVMRYVSEIRSQRLGMVQTPEQYKMIYRYLYEVLIGSDAW